jgi:hypothetical protein
VSLGCRHETCIEFGGDFETSRRDADARPSSSMLGGTDTDSSKRDIDDRSIAALCSSLVFDPCVISCRDDGYASKWAVNFPFV